jgi:hypothetical protein
MRIVRELVKPQRDESNERRVRENWWKFGRPSAHLYEMIQSRGLSHVIAIPEVTKALLPVFLPSDAVYQHTLVVFASEDPAMFGLLSSSFHTLWVMKRCRTMRTDPTYNPGRAFLNFPLPRDLSLLTQAGDQLNGRQRQAMRRSEQGLTSLYNRVGDPNCHESTIDELRALQIALDAAAARSYGWDDLIDQFDHGHHATERFGVRWTVAPETQREIERRLLMLNLERAAMQ